MAESIKIMKLLFITQIVDKDDTYLGFVHSWIEEFSKRFESFDVICLKKGSYDLPGISVDSLGKEGGASRVKYVFRLFHLIISRRKQYDAVFVHMNQEYILIAGWLWRLMGKRVFMWRNHPAGTILTDIASVFCTKVFCTSQRAYAAKYKKTILMPVGVDTDVFKPDQAIERKPKSILSIGRIAPVKRLEVLINALKILDRSGQSFAASIYGDSLPVDSGYHQSLHDLVSESGLEERIAFHKGVPIHKVPTIYSANEIFVNMTPSGSYDKTMFEAMASETLVIACNKDLKGQIDDSFIFEEEDAAELAHRLAVWLKKDRSAVLAEAKKLRDYVIANHSLSALSLKLRDIISKNSHDK